MFPTLDEVRAYAAEGRYRRVPMRMELLADRVGHESQPLHVLLHQRRHGAGGCIARNADAPGRRRGEDVSAGRHTRPRGATAAEDAALEAGLLADQKELAEHNMLVDLGRNDL